MWRKFISLFMVRRAIFKWESNQGSGRVKVIFRGSFSQAEASGYALGQIRNFMRENEVLLDLSFVGIEQ